MRHRLPLRPLVKVEMHLPGGFTRVLLIEIADGRGFWDIPTEKIPTPLRVLGAKFFVVAPSFDVEINDSADAIRKVLSELRVEECE